MRSLPTDQERQVRELALAGRLIEAIKLYRKITDADLKEAKDAVEAIMHGASAGTPRHLKSDAQEATLLEEQVKQLLRKRQKIQAVRIYREAHQCGLKEAKDAVDAIEAQMRMYENSDYSTAPAVGNDPFAEDARRNRGPLVFAIAIFLVGILGLAFYYFLNNGI